jgi:predicted Fe-Mo cluster-binding NifX family protein
MHMQVAVTADGQDLDAPTSPVFGRCSTYILVDTETMQFESMANPALSVSGGAGSRVLCEVWAACKCHV